VKEFRKQAHLELQTVAISFLAGSRKLVHTSKSSMPNASILSVDSDEVARYVLGRLGRKIKFDCSDSPLSEESGIQASHFPRTIRISLSRNDTMICYLPFINNFMSFQFCTTGNFQADPHGSTWCEPRGFEQDFPRNFICFDGRVFRVSLLSVSISAVPIVPNFVLPRVLKRIWRDSYSSSIDASSPVQFVAFEFRSELYEIATDSFSNYSSLKSICLPASVLALGRISKVLSSGVDARTDLASAR
jgi:hypothetical protein